MWNWIKSKLGFGGIKTNAQIMAPLQKQRDALDLASSQRVTEIEDNLLKIKALEVSNKVHEEQRKEAQNLIGALDSILNPTK